jgi:predicted DNA-binding antitoxin AbrB/MazE fold protein
MTTAIKATYEDGVFKPKEPVELQEKTEVEVLIPTPAPADEDDPTGWKTAMELMGCIEDGPEDGAENHDRYIYGFDEER